MNSVHGQIQNLELPWILQTLYLSNSIVAQHENSQMFQMIDILDFRYQIIIQIQIAQIRQVRQMLHLLDSVVWYLAIFSMCFFLKNGKLIQSEYSIADSQPFMRRLIL